MKAAIVPSANSAWVLREVSTPEPGPNQVLIKIRASGMCYTDVHQTDGGIPGTFPRTLGRDLGADEVVRDGAGLAGAGGADIVLGTSNSMDATADMIQGLRPDGRLVIMGVEAKPLAVSPFDLLTKRIKIIGSQQNGREYLYEALAIAASGKVRVVTETYRLDEIGKAYERVEKGQVRFRAVITM